MRGSIDPGDNETGWNFQYSTDPGGRRVDRRPRLARTVHRRRDAGPQLVEENLHEVPGSCCPTFGVALKPGTNYKLRLKATNVGRGILLAEVGEFTTLPVAPPTIVNFAGATDIGNYTAEPVATINRPVGTNYAFDVSCRFEYITDAAYQPRNEKQQLRVRANGGTYTLSFGGETTAPIAYDATGRDRPGARSRASPPSARAASPSAAAPAAPAAPSPTRSSSPARWRSKTSNRSPATAAG